MCKNISDSRLFIIPKRSTVCFWANVVSGAYVAAIKINGFLSGTSERLSEIFMRALQVCTFMKTFTEYSQMKIPEGIEAEHCDNFSLVFRTRTKQKLNKSEKLS